MRDVAAAGEDQQEPRHRAGADVEDAHEGALREK